MILRSFVVLREGDDEICAFAVLRFYTDIAAAQFYDTLNKGQSKSVALGGVCTVALIETLEDMGDSLLIHAYAVVGYGGGYGVVFF